MALVDVPLIRQKGRMTTHFDSLPRSVCVYCGSAPGHDPRFRADAAALGTALAEAGIGLVYGGGNSGLMGEVARSVLQNGGYVTGIIPEFLKSRELMLDGAQEMIVVNDMHTRKRLMFERSAAFVALPGGMGTLEELFEQVTWVQLEQHDKPVVIANLHHFWDPLLHLIEHVKTSGFVRPGLAPHFEVVDDVRQIVPILKSRCPAL